MTNPMPTGSRDLLDIDEVRIAAERAMPDAYRDFVNNRGMERTLEDDIRAWSSLHLRPRALVNVRDVDTSVTILGARISMPIITAPFVGSTFVHREGEVATARGAMAAGTITTLSMNGARTPEEVGAVARGHYWQQLYWVRDRGVLRDVVARAVASGASALCLTVDLPVLPSFPRPMRDPWVSSSSDGVRMSMRCSLSAITAISRSVPPFLMPEQLGRISNGCGDSPTSRSSSRV